MATVTKTELNQQTAKVLARVQAGERLTITDRGRPIAELTPPADTAWQRLVASGRVTLPKKSGRLEAPAARSTRSTADILEDIRGDRV
ncbi:MULTISPECIES: type II toxin-antitoxin system Phd/YefM family antitoxin [unclassified Microbacterium]|uniref:type II toxin-antitoxin system Phd/YefM family antitoxin n=1 Tax=unclassified Microbacterium TaxID=2609290 RepID=UPI000EAAAB7E|nr:MULTISPECIES: type II toxin-antitoxin system prevent-host-death family antitoxin [unclassified Microbacterium]MBT2484260.1 type II toxin-antitoxin system prevent-host-death family antitoxin [Microbacterium sp. ISL-108]RKN67183.1 type II toxin-antitoxin system prevent-host-death family antitoxin [Microbacterium sp. CGR2]